TTTGGGGSGGASGAGGATSSGGSAGQGGSGGAALCTSAERAAKWASMDIAPIQLPNQAALLNLAGKNQQGLTVDEAQSILCEGKMIGDAFGDGNSVIQWGDKGEVELEFVPATMLGTMLTLQSGYAGLLAFNGATPGTKYAVVVGAQILKDG